jgi:predicted nucleic acid-binding protein
MPDKIFIDTNLWVYLFLDSEKITDINKKNTVSEILKKSSNIVISAQVLNEVSNVFIKKYKFDLGKIGNIIDKILDSTEVYPITSDNTINSLKLLKKYSLSFYDGLIISSALESGCNKLFSEDMHNALVIDKKLTIINPFESK